MADVVFKVMVSRSFRDLRGCREAVRDAIEGRGMLSLMMEQDAAISDRGNIWNSLAMVDAADAYVVLISNYRYGQVIDDAALNPKTLSVTELEFGRAEERKLPICLFLTPPTSSRSTTNPTSAACSPNTPRSRASVPTRARRAHPSRCYCKLTTGRRWPTRPGRNLGDRRGQAGAPLRLRGGACFLLVSLAGRRRPSHDRQNPVAGEK
jgi:hypothetical protein